jgi:hypothetical protein
MKRLVFTVLALGVILSSCDNLQSVKSSSHPSLDSIILSSATDVNGVTLNMKFDNAQDIAVFILGGDTITMQADTMASGVHFHNETYEYSEWHGEITLTKDGEVIFESKGE